MSSGQDAQWSSFTRSFYLEVNDESDKGEGLTPIKTLERNSQSSASINDSCKELRNKVKES
jgi:hypothetical protein